MNIDELKCFTFDLPVKVYMAAKACMPHVFTEYGSPPSGFKYHKFILGSTSNVNSIGFTRFSFENIQKCVAKCSIL